MCDDKIAVVAQKEVRHSRYGLPFVFSEQAFQTAFLQFRYPSAKKIWGVQRGAIPFDAGFPIGARAALLAHDFALQSLVCYTFASG